MTGKQIDAAARALRFVSHGVPHDSPMAEDSSWRGYARAALVAADTAYHEIPKRAVAK
jgi:hypothetical protein